MLNALKKRAGIGTPLQIAMKTNIYHELREPAEAGYMEKFSPAGVFCFVGYPSMPDPASLPIRAESHILSFNKLSLLSPSFLSPLTGDCPWCP